MIIRIAPCEEGSQSPGLCYPVHHSFLRPGRKDRHWRQHKQTQGRRHHRHGCAHAQTSCATDRDAPPGPWFTPTFARNPCSRSAWSRQLSLCGSQSSSGASKAQEEPLDLDMDMPRRGIDSASMARGSRPIASIILRTCPRLTPMSSMSCSDMVWICLLYTSPSPRDATLSRMPSSA